MIIPSTTTRNSWEVDVIRHARAYGPTSVTKWAGQQLPTGFSLVGVPFPIGAYCYARTVQTALLDLVIKTGTRAAQSCDVEVEKMALQRARTVRRLGECCMMSFASTQSVGHPRTEETQFFQEKTLCRGGQTGPNSFNCRDRATDRIIAPPKRSTSIAQRTQRRHLKYQADRGAGIEPDHCDKTRWTSKVSKKTLSADETNVSSKPKSSQH